MKTLIAIIMSISFLMGASGCDSTTSSKSFKLKNVDISKFSDAEEYDIYRWPTIGIASEIPIPNWSNRGWIDYDEPDRFRCRVGYTTFDDFSNYICELQEFGFVNNYISDGKWKYYAETDDGWGIILYFYDSISDMSMQVARDHRNLDKSFLFI